MRERKQGEKLRGRKESGSEDDDEEDGGEKHTEKVIRKS